MNEGWTHCALSKLDFDFGSVIKGQKNEEEKAQYISLL